MPDAAEATLPVLICGAGPTGLALAIGLVRRGIAVRIVDENAESGLHSRAMVVHARTLEFYRALGFAERMIAEGIPVETVRVREGGGVEAREVLAADLATIGQGLSPYPFVLCYPQDDHERFLVRELESLGTAVERGTVLTGFSEAGDAVDAVLRHGDGREERVRASYLCGCDGAHSAVRHGMGVGFPGGTYEQLFYVADVKIDGPLRTDLTVNLGRNTLALMLPVRLTGMQRLIGLVPPALSDRPDLDFEAIRTDVEALLGLTVAAVNWFSIYRVHHRVAEHFRKGRAFILGDAGHIHSPAGGQGMNTGIGDAINLAWKLADVLRGRAPETLLDSYESERITFARQLVGTTDRAFTALVSGGAFGQLTRRFVVPLALSAGLRFGATRHAFFRLVSQIGIAYRDSALSAGEAGAVKGGDRLPWVASQDNFAPLASLGWQLHVYGDAHPDLKRAAQALGLPLHRFAWDGDAEGAGIAIDAALLVRPDGYVALAAGRADAAAALEAYARQHALRLA
jgi:2-polyprenyl-6-methoxyphenol hydroxylase-like FAD-dependent oxidoreductase